MNLEFFLIVIIILQIFQLQWFSKLLNLLWNIRTFRRFRKNPKRMIYQNISKLRDKIKRE